MKIRLVSHERWSEMKWFEYLNSVSRYDLVLAVIPTAFLTALLTANLLALPARSTLVIAGFVSALVLIDALFLNPPRRPENPS